MPTIAWCREIVPAMSLLFAVGFYCHRIFGAYFTLEGDAFQNIYFRLNEDLIPADFNPFQWYYNAWMPPTGFFNPVIRIFTALLGVVGPSDEMTQAFWINVLTSGFLLWVLAIAVYALLRGFHQKRASSVAGAIIASFTGNHLVGIFEFDQMYLLSFAAVPPAIFCAWKTSAAKSNPKWAMGLAVVIGVSLLGGSNAPMFYYVPLFFFLPLLAGKCARRDVFICELKLGLAVATGIISAATTLLPPISSLGETLRGNLNFELPITSIAHGDALARIFLRDFFVTSGWHFHETDYFLGLPALALAVIGLRGNKANRIAWFFVGCAGFGILITRFSFLPQCLRLPIAWLYEHLSIRFPNRFSNLLLLPVAYFAARGFERARDRWLPATLAALLLIFGVLIYFFLVPNWNAQFIDTRVSALFSCGFAVLTVFALAFRYRAQTPLTVKILSFTALFCLFGTYATAFVQSTRYPIEMGKNSRAIASLPAERLNVKAILGLENHYAENAARMRKFFFEPPPALRDPITQTGRILDLEELTGKRANYYAPRTGHHFAFTALTDLASPHRIYDLARLNREAILDLTSVCWVIRQNGPLVARPTCFPPTFLAPTLYRAQNEADGLRFLAKASREQLRQQLSVNCAETDCGLLQIAGRTLADAHVDLVRADAGEMNFRVQTLQAAFLFLSVPYRRDWHAEINGTAHAPFRADHAFMGLAVPAGTSEITFSLSHERQWVGLGISLVLFTLLGFCLLRRPLDYRRLGASQAVAPNTRQPISNP